MMTIHKAENEENANPTLALSGTNVLFYFGIEANTTNAMLLVRLHLIRFDSIQFDSIRVDDFFHQ